MASEFTEKVVSIIKAIPEGKVLTYGAVAAMAGSPRAARQVVRILHTQTEKHNLPWHRVIGAGGRISIKQIDGRMEQRFMLEDEGVHFDEQGRTDLEKYMWEGISS